MLPFDKLNCRADATFSFDVQRLMFNVQRSSREIFDRLSHPFIPVRHYHWLSFLSFKFRVSSFYFCTNT
jgi:hypothetical protein